MDFRAILPFRARKQRPRVSASLALAGVAAGAAAVALLEPRGGARRRGLVVQKTIHSGKAARTFGQKAARDLANRSRGLLASARSSVRESGVSDDVLCERVRSRVGRLTSHPAAIEVSARGGVIELRGPVLEREAEQVLAGTRRVRGAREVEDHLQRHAEPGNVPRLQGGAARSRPVPEILQQSWAPATRLLAIVSGAGLALGGLSARRPKARAMGVIGALLALRGATNLPLKRLFGVGARRRGVDVHKTIHIEAPRPEVFAFFSAFENFPRFMAHVRDVHRTGDGRWHWTVDGPAGASVEWDAEVSALEANEVVAWKTLPGAAVASSGIARFEDEGSGTRLDIRLSYNPPAGAVGHAFAVLVGADPKRQMNDDLLRFKSLLERGKAEGVTRQELRPRE
jgi:uncharacterized membrane protein